MPSVIDQRYELLAEIGKGGSGSVHRARDLQTGTTVAVKILHVDVDLDVDKENELARFNRESNLLSKMQHSNIVAYIAHGSSGNGVHFLVEEWVSGGTLRKRIREGGPGVSAREAVTIGLGVAEALAAAHALDVIHRDIKPENILLADQLSHVKLADFGIARLADPDFRLTRTGVMLGTPAYMAPEQARGDSDIGPAADVWGLGCVLFEMLGGRTPFAGHHSAAIRAKVILEPPPDLAILCPEAPGDLIALVKQMLSKDPNLRPANGSAVVEGLRSCSPVPDGPRRLSHVIETRTKAMPVRGHVTPTDADAEINYMMFAAPIAELDRDTSTDHARVLAEVAVAHDLTVNLLNDGTMFLVARRDGRMGAVDVTRAARRLAKLPNIAISVVGHKIGARHDALDRGAAALEQSSIDIMFGGGASVWIDPCVAELVGQAELVGMPWRK